jgi:hypothetical protein
MGDGASDTSTMMQAALTQLTGMVSGLQGEVHRLQAQLGKKEQTAASHHAPVPEAHVTQGSHTKDPKLPMPDKYDGSSQSGAVENFIFRCEQYFRGMRTPDDRKVYFAAGLLTQSAASWWRFTCMSHGGDDTLYEWDVFSAQLLTRFRAVNSSRHARDQLANLVQTGSVRAYATKMQELAMQIPDIGEGELKDRFIRGLKRRTQEAVVMREPCTFEEAVQLADRYDSLWGSSNLFANQPRRTAAGQWTSTAKQPISTNPIPSRYPAGTSSEPVPMEIDALRRRNSPLTPTERARLVKLGGCFYCRQLGHMIAECPNKPPSTPMQRSVAQVESSTQPGLTPDLIDLGAEPRCSENSMPQ